MVSDSVLEGGRPPLHGIDVDEGSVEAERCEEA
jgi:hypothetical protein